MEELGQRSQRKYWGGGGVLKLFKFVVVVAIFFVYLSDK